MKKVLWLSREPFQPVQFGALERVVGSPLEIITIDPLDIEDDFLEDIVELIERYEFDDVLAVLPKPLLRYFANAVPRPLWANCYEVPRGVFTPSHFTTPDGRHFRFSGLQRLIDRTLMRRNLGPEADWWPEDDERAKSVPPPRVVGLYDRPELADEGVEP